MFSLFLFLGEFGLIKNIPFVPKLIQITKVVK